MSERLSGARRPAEAAGRPAPTPLARFLARCHETYAADQGGALADYIPELTKADTRHFGIAVATIDGHVYEVGDSAVPFTIQSVSKAFVFALALELIGAARVEATIGVEPSGDVFNSIRLRADSRPFNPMVNAGAIAVSALIHKAEGEGAFERIRQALGRFAGRELAVDEAVFASERLTGDRNRAIAYLLRNNSVIDGDVDAILDVYFRQCSVMVTARDLAIMGATLANRGVNPVTGETVVVPYTVARTLSVMTSAGMYDFAGEWIYRVGIPAKSGVGGGIVAVLPAQLGLGTYSPLLDSHGNSVRGLKTCEALSAHFDLHVLNRSGDIRTCIMADYDVGRVSSRRIRQPQERVILDAHAASIHILELAGALSFATIDYVSRRLAAKPAKPEFLILDFHRVPAITEAGAKLFADILGELAAAGVTAILCGMKQPSPLRAALEAPLDGGARQIRWLRTLDEAIEWAEDQVIFVHGGFTNLKALTELADQALLAGLGPEELRLIADLGTPRRFRPGERIVAEGDPATSLFFLRSGMVSVKLGTGVRVSTMVPGMAFGEMALISGTRIADVWADTATECLELPLERYDAFRARHPASGERIMRNLAALLARRLGEANAKIDVLSGN
ncbi:MAG TPA: glutaminase A [Alphaproteobacteria bacterium]|jgi:glutaminase|nr:glutaminase A [Alphaproteobacteria bacterium]